MTKIAILTALLAVFGLLPLVYAVMLYNGLVRLKHGVSKAWANIDVLMRQRHDELPKLVQTCQQHMQYEQETLERIVQARSAVALAGQQQDMVALGRAESQLRSGLGRLFALAENHPTLKANDSFLHLHQRISALEESISDRRELYNEAVNLNNVRIEQFPDVLLARLFSFRAAVLLEFEEKQMLDPEIQKLFAK